MRILLAICLLWLSLLSWAFSENELITLLQTPQNVQGDFTQQRFLKSLTSSPTFCQSIIITLIIFVSISL